MNFYVSLNQMIDYIEAHLLEKIDYKVLARFLGVNAYTMERVFSLLCNMTITEYIRMRRLSMACYDLLYGKEKIIDIAIKYGYENPISFSRAFQKFHGLKPSEVQKGNGNFKNFPKIHFEDRVVPNVTMEYQIRSLPEFVLYGKGKKVTDSTISREAPKFFSYMKKNYHVFDYGMVVYENRFYSDNYEYWVLTKEERSDLERYVIPASKWLVFYLPSLKAKDIQKLADDFYYSFLPSSKFNLRPIPELEIYYKDYMEFLIPIED